MSKGFASNYRMVVLSGAVLLSFAGIGARLYYLHVLDRDRLLGAIEKARSELIPDYARRGDILDSKGALLATTREVFVVGVDPTMARRGDEKKWPQLAALLGVPLEKIEPILTTKYRQAPSRLGDAEGAKPGLVLNLNPDPAGEAKSDDTQLGDAEADGRRPIQWAKLAEDVPPSTYDQIEKLEIRGVYGDRVYRRSYPHNELAAHIIGYVDKDEQPVTGVESFANFYLRGENGWVETEKDGLRRELAQFRTREVPAYDGYSVVLSIDGMIQHIAEAELQYIAQKYQPQRATIIIGDPRTGFILALANYPSFDPNTYNKLPKDEMGRLTDAAIADVYEPGSVFKIVAAAAALNDGLVTRDTTFNCTLQKVAYYKSVRQGLSPIRSLPREDASDAGKFDHPLSVADIIAESSNKGAAQLAMLLGDRRFYDYVRAFGFGQRTGFPTLGGESPGILAPPKEWDGLTITRMPMGQSIGVTPLQIHQAMGVIASGGVLLRPQIIREIRNPAGDAVYRFERAEVRRVISVHTADVMRQLLERVASDEGTSVLAEIPGYEVAGKTGTSNKVIDGRYSKNHHVLSFVGFLPASDPQIAISVIIDDADAHIPPGLVYGGKIAAPSFKRIAEQLISYWDIRPPVEHKGGPVLALEGGRR